jgi:hypothetical protein
MFLLTTCGTLCKQSFGVGGCTPTPNDTNAYHTHHCCNTIQTCNTHNHIARWLDKSVYTLYGWTCHPLAVQNTHSHKATQGNARQRKAAQGNARQGNARQRNTRQRKATQSCPAHRTGGRNACRRETWPDASRLRPRRRGHGRTSYPHKLTGYWGPHMPKPNTPSTTTTPYSDAPRHTNRRTDRETKKEATRNTYTPTECTDAHSAKCTNETTF